MNNNIFPKARIPSKIFTLLLPHLDGKITWLSHWSRWISVCAFIDYMQSLLLGEVRRASHKKNQSLKKKKLKKKEKRNDFSAPLVAPGMRHLYKFFLHWFFSTCATDFAEKEGLLVVVMLLSPVTLTKIL